MIDPVRCVACSKYLASICTQSKKLTNDLQYSWEETFEKLGVKRLCCRTHIMTVPHPAATFVNQATGDRSMFAGRAKMCSDLEKERKIFLA